MLPILNIGPLAIQLPGVLLLIGVWVGSILAERAAQRNAISAEAVTNLLFFGLIAGVLGARVGYALRFIPIYLENPLGLISLNLSTLSLPEGLLAGVLVALIYGQRQRLPLWTTLDSLAPGMAAFSVALGCAHLASGDAFGAASQVPWAIELWGARRHPTQIYEILFSAVVLAIVLRLKPGVSFAGFTFFSWVLLASAGYLIIGAFRGDSVVVFQALRRGQLISLMAMLGALIGMHYRARAALIPLKTSD